MLASVIIPTYNRPEAVIRLLESLKGQTMSPDTFEVIVVDDGSDYDEKVVSNRGILHHFIFLRQSNQGATIARNNGTLKSRGKVLIFIDDDVTISSHTLETLYQACISNEKTLAIGRLLQRSPRTNTKFAQLMNQDMSADHQGLENPQSDEYLHFSFCNTQLLAVSRQAFFDLGMLQDPTGGWPNWDDVDFGYRAHLAGYKLLKCGEAQGTHWDASLSSLEQTCQRWYRASKSAVALFRRHPGLQPFLPMYFDKTPIDWMGDSPYLITRKMVRRIASSKVSIFLMEHIVSMIEKIFPSPKILLRLYRWLQGGYMLMGYFAGLKEVGRTP